MLLGAASGAIAGSAGAGLVSALSTLGMPKEKATVYQTRLQAGEFLVLVEVPAVKSGEFRLLLESAGGEEIHQSNLTLPRPCEGPCNSPEDLSPEIRSHLSPSAQRIFVDQYNAALDKTQDESKAEQAAWHTIHERFDEDEAGVWARDKVLS